MLLQVSGSGDDYAIQRRIFFIVEKGVLIIEAEHQLR